MGRARQRVELERQRKALEAELKRTKARIAHIHALQLEDLAEGRVPVSFQLDGCNIHLRTDLRCSVGDEDLYELLQTGDSGGDYLVKETINANSLSAWVREHLPPGVKVRDEAHLHQLLLSDEPKPLPPELLPHIKTTLVREIRVLGAGTNDTTDPKE